MTARAAVDAIAPTPGPWTMNGTEILDRYENQIAVVRPYGAGFAPSGYVFPWQVKNANARLIASAPDLLAALVEARAQMQLRLDALGPVRSATWLRLHEAIEGADAAIAKAEGR